MRPDRWIELLGKLTNARGDLVESVVSVSVIVPVYNDPEGIRLTLDTLLAQSYPVENHEILVVDNGSTDETRDMIRRFSTAHDHISLLIEDEVQGSYAARNEGIRNATGELLAFLDADVTVDHDWLERGVKRFGGDVDYLACDVELYSQGRETLVGKYDKHCGFPVKRYLEESHFGPTCGLFVRASVFDEVGLFDERLISGGDGEFGSRVHGAGKEQRFANDVSVYHPTRSSLRSLIGKHVRIGRGFYQRSQYYPKRYARSGWSVRNVLPMRPWVVKRHCQDWERLRFYEKVVLYLIAYVLKVSRTGGRVRQAIETGHQ